VFSFWPLAFTPHRLVIHDADLFPKALVSPACLT
jgi:hypothetical protein